ncbi:MAG: hydroxymethylpyrimidine/phosphomethylpyrimidine kinase [Candidatus Aminicenantes bacterium]|nr:hydroxymethylpyrimidine/phosphomethylpyrimidine kinase [Candidatus Aminicenantes bacterium]
MILVTIAGFDPSGGAGVLLDTSVFKALGFHGTAVLTAVTVQNTSTVVRVRTLSPRLVRDQFLALKRDLAVAGLKVGMAGSAANIQEIGRLLARHTDIPRVVDPVLRSSSGRALAGKASALHYLRALHGRAEVLTPNLAEAARLSGRPVRTVAEMRDAAAAVFDRTGIPCLVKGGHLPGAPVNLLYDGKHIALFGIKRLRRDVHGTGCFFSAALLGFLVRKGDLFAAAEAATEWTHRAIVSSIRIGRGRAVFTPLSIPKP